MKKGFFEYTCTFWDECIRDIKTTHGVVFTNSFTNAMYEIEKCYGEDNINSISFAINENFSSNVFEFETDPVNFTVYVKESEDA